MSLSTQFLSSILGFIKKQDGASLRLWLRVEPDAPTQYLQLGQELRTQFRGDASIHSLVEKCLPLRSDDGDGGGGAPWLSFILFMKDYMLYWRDVNFDDLPALYALLSGLLTSCATAFTHPSGPVMLETSVAICEALAKLAMVMHHRPDLTRRMQPSAAAGGAGGGGTAAGGGGDEERKSLVESTADAIQKVCTACVTDRGSARFARPEGRRVAVYRLANLVLKLLFAGDKARWAAQMFTNITNTGPPLAFYPAAQRVTYLYYLGRFHLENNHFQRAALCLEAAYRQTPPACRRHRRLILTYLIPANLLLGIFPSAALLLRPEAADELRPVFAPMAAAVRQGNFAAFQATLHEHEAWLVRRRLLLTLAYRMRPLLWRSLVRRVFLLTYVPPPNSDAVVSSAATAARGRAAPTLDLADVLAAATLAQHQIEGYAPVAPTPRPRAEHTNTLFMRAVANNANAARSTVAVPPSGVRKLRPSEGMVWGNLPVTMADVESVVSSLAAQGLMHGFVAHAAHKFAVVGAKAKGAVLAGFPPVAEVMREQLQQSDVDINSVPAWVKAP
ncbi:cop9 signalosome complex subunit 12 [Sporothrix brasiliensis 5110]|uniref:Cop9 signalosome complex subunit 12 n=1 Tax=Sporothrix brasiliensis 5110 TaxID=1398154 RepID=A0A0C2F5Q4_9PEZI|nr:cop9 signalosome complex subunit 12 [Sporothrix brasiliensis 5110]KIH94224.1 cop9 signalosome complex subunit 12 [Sporothrix brasiliensis 5110]